MAVESASQTTIIRLPRSVVWRSMQDPAILRQCIEGCDRLDRDTDNRFRISVNYKIGPLKRVSKGTITLTDIVPNVSLRFFRGSYKPVVGPGAFSGTVSLKDHPEGTEMTTQYQFEASALTQMLMKAFSPSRAKKQLNKLIGQFEAAASAANSDAA